MWCSTSRLRSVLLCTSVHQLTLRSTWPPADQPCKPALQTLGPLFLAAVTVTCHRACLSLPSNIYDRFLRNELNHTLSGEVNPIQLPFQHAPNPPGRLLDADTPCAREDMVTTRSRGAASDTMPSRLPLPDGRAQREDDLAQSSRMVAHRHIARADTTPRDTPPTTGESRFGGTLSVETTSPALSPGPARRTVVFPDPVAFRCASFPSSCSSGHD